MNLSILPPWLNPKWLLYGIIGIFLVIGGLTAANFVTDPFGWRENREQSLQIDAALAKGEAATSKGQASYARDVSGIIDRRATRERTLGETEYENDQKLGQTSASSIRLPDDFVDALNSSLCEYRSTTGCDSDPVLE